MARKRGVSTKSLLFIRALLFIYILLLIIPAFAPGLPSSDTEPDSTDANITSRGYIIELDSEPALEVRNRISGEISRERDTLNRSGRLYKSTLGIIDSISIHAKELGLNSSVSDARDAARLEQQRFQNVAARRLGKRAAYLGNRTRYSYTDAINAVALNITPEEANAIKSMPGVQAVYPDEQVSIALKDSTRVINADDVWELDSNLNECQYSGKPCLNGQGIRVGIIDTGIDYTHPDLGGGSAPTERPLYTMNYTGVESMLGLADADNQIQLDDSRIAYMSGRYIIIRDRSSTDGNYTAITLPADYYWLNMIAMRANLVAYVASDININASAVFIYNLSSGRHTKVADISSASGLCFAGNMLTYGVTKAQSGEAAIFSYDLATGEEHKLVTFPANSLYPHTCADTRIFYNQFGGLDSYSCYSAFVMDAATGATQPIVSVNMGPVLDAKGDNVLYVECNMSQSPRNFDVFYLHNLKDNTTKRIQYPSSSAKSSSEDSRTTWLYNTFWTSKASIGERCIFFYRYGLEGKWVACYDQASGRYSQINIATPAYSPKSSGDTICFLTSDRSIKCHDYNPAQSYDEAKGGFNIKVVGGYDFVNSDPDPKDDHGHGTHCAGIVAADGRLKGVAPKASLYAYKVLDRYGRGYWSDIIAAIEQSTDPNQDGDTSDHLDVISMSLGGTGGNPDDPVSQAVDRAVDAGVVAVIAAGNSGPAPQTIATPGNARKAITVGATSKYDELAAFSSRGPVVWQGGSMNKPDLSAPGVYITSTYLSFGYAEMSGTSMATPHVAGAAALLLQKSHSLTPADVKALLVNGTSHLPCSLDDCGSGRLDVLAAVETGSINLSWSKRAVLSGSDAKSSSPSVSSAVSRHIAYASSANASDFSASNTAIYYARIAADGSVALAPINLTTGSSNVYEPSVAADMSDDAYVFWTSDQDGNREIYGTRVSQDAITIPPMRITSSYPDSVMPKAVADINKSIHLFWIEDSGTFNNIYYVLLGPDLLPRFIPRLIASNVRNYNIAGSDQGIFLAYESLQGDIMLRKISLGGTLLVSSATPGKGRIPAISANKQVTVAYSNLTGGISEAEYDSLYNLIGNSLLPGTQNAGTIDSIAISDTLSPFIAWIEYDGNETNATANATAHIMWHAGSNRNNGEIDLGNANAGHPHTPSRICLSTSPYIIAYQDAIDEWGGQGIIFHTSSSDSSTPVKRLPVITSSYITDIREYSAMLTFTTDILTRYTVNYEDSSHNIYSLTSQELSSSHSVLFRDLSESTAYNITISVVDAYGNSNTESRSAHLAFSTIRPENRPALPTSFYGSVIYENSTPAEGFDVLASWVDTNNYVHESRARSLTFEEAEARGNISLAGYYFFTKGDVKARGGSVINITLPGITSDSRDTNSQTVVASPGSGLVIVSGGPIVVDGTAAELAVHSPAPRDYNMSSGKPHLNFTSNKRLGGAYYSLNSRPLVNVTGMEGSAIGLTSALGENNLTLFAITEVGIKSEKSVQFRMLDNIAPILNATVPARMNSISELSATLADDYGLNDTCEACISNSSGYGNFSCNEWGSKWTAGRPDFAFGSRAGSCKYFLDTRQYIDGNYTIIFRGYDTSSNPGISLPVDFEIDNTPPGKVQLRVSPAGNNLSSVIVTWSKPSLTRADEILTYYVYRQGENFTDTRGYTPIAIIKSDVKSGTNRSISNSINNNTNSTTITDSGLLEGIAYYYGATAADELGNRGTLADAAFAFLPDTHAPAISIASPANATYIITRNDSSDSNASITLAATAFDTLAECWYDLTGQNRSTRKASAGFSNGNRSHWDSPAISPATISATITAFSGGNSLNLSCTDTAGNTGKSSVSFTAVIIECNPENGEDCINMYCGDGGCNNMENCSSCPEDCGVCRICEDNDSDGYGKCPNCGIAYGCANEGSDCNDNNKSIHPGAPEVCSNYIDENCDGNLTAGCYTCGDGSCDLLAGESESNCPEDCDKSPPIITISSPKPMLYATNQLALVFHANEPVHGCTASLNRVASPVEPGGFIESNSASSNRPTAFSTGIIASEGENSLEVSCSDAYNNTGSSSVSFAVDTIPPAAIHGLLALEKEDELAVLLAWTASNDRELNEYRIYRSLGNFSSSASAGVKFLGTTNSTSYLDNSVEIGLEYYYAVAAVDTAGNEKKEVEATNVSVQEVPPPEPVRGLTLVSTPRTNRMTMSWQRSSYAGLDTYRIYRSYEEFNDTKGLSPLATVAKSVTSYIDNTVESSGHYCYAISAVSIYGKSGSSVECRCADSADTKAPAPVISLAVVQLKDEASLRCEWDESIESDVAAYNIYRQKQAYSTLEGLSPVATVNGSSNNGKFAYTDTQLMPGTAYYYAVAAVDASGNMNSTVSPVRESVYDSAPPIVSVEDVGGKVIDFAVLSASIKDRGDGLLGSCEVCIGISSECNAWMPATSLFSRGNISGSCIYPWHTEEMKTGKYYYNFRTSDINGNIGLGTPVAVQVARPEPIISYNMSLNSGWNLMSLPIQPLDNWPKSLLQPIEGKYWKIYSYDSLTGSWKSYSPERDVNDEEELLSTIVHGKAYWINMKEEGVLPVDGYRLLNYSASLEPGWQMIGVPLLTEMPAKDVLASLRDEYYAAYSYDAPSESWLVYRPVPSLYNPNTMINITSGTGIIINMRGYALWQP